ncbi:fumarate hydratase/fumarase [Cenarchaeum symbiosum A]|uniref:Fumarate hydratase/fumarase n=1 Tax=Cenarchaeum symbiosum (strain A) TaxID=414004 RepID=A0RW57_CENSY|nr:fumarate hydratase/fumarase [Cenarchaeum symbiosum A]
MHAGIAPLNIIQAWGGRDRVIKPARSCGPVRYRTDEDSLGRVKIPADAYYGPFTARAAEQYRVTGTAAHPALIEAYSMIKRSAAAANTKAGALDARRGRAITRACDMVLSGRFRDQFVIDMINSGAGTAFNMNANEVIANVALEIAGRKLGDYEYIHPNDHVNMSQSTNDTFPTAMHVSILGGSGRALSGVGMLVRSLKSKARSFARHKKIGRTHLMDALPVTLGGELAAHATAASRAGAALAYSMKGLEPVALGGTAVGTGANTPRGYRRAAIRELARISGLRLRPEPDMQYALQSRLAVAGVSSALRNLALELGRLANDIRLMASGPVAGLSEIGIPAVHAGSSIMPGKVNPSLAECMNMVCYSIIGNDTAAAHAVQAGQFELNVMLPGMLKSVLESTDMLASFLPVFSANLIDGLTADKKGLRGRIESSPVIVTLLAPRIGYSRSAELYKESLGTGRTIRDIAVSGGLVTNKEMDKLLG